MKQKLWIALVTYLSYCIDKERYKAIDYLKSQVGVLVEQQEKQNKRILLTNKQRMRVAAKAKRLSRKMLEQCTVLFTADTIIGWYNKLIAEKYDGSQNRSKVGRPQISQEIIDLVITFKEENPRWGYQKTTDQIVYKSIFEKLQGLRGRRQEFKDESERLYLQEYERYRDEISQQDA